MSKISLKPNDSGTGTFTLESPNSNTNRTLSLPDADGTVATEENLPAGYTDSDALDLFNATGSAPVYACRAWVNFDGTNTTIRDSGNVSSITDNGTGDYTVNFATAMPDADYCVNGASQFDQNTEFFGNGRELTLIIPKGVTNPLTSNSARVRTIDYKSDAYSDGIIVTVAIFR